MIFKGELEGHKIQQITLWLEIHEKIEVAGTPREARGPGAENPYPRYPMGLGDLPEVRDPLAQNTFYHATPEGKREDRDLFSPAYILP